MGGKGETGRGEQVRSSPCIKLKAGLFIAALLADYSPGSMTGQEHCHHCFHNLSFVEKQKVSLPLLPAPLSRRQRASGSACRSTGQRSLPAHRRGQCIARTPEPFQGEPVRPRKEQPRPVICSGLSELSPPRSEPELGLGRIRLLPFLPQLIPEPETSRHPASSRSASGFLGNLPCCDSSNITRTARTKPLKEEDPLPLLTLTTEAAAGNTACRRRWKMSPRHRRMEDTQASFPPALEVMLGWVALRCCCTFPVVCACCSLTASNRSV